MNENLITTVSGTTNTQKSSGGIESNTNTYGGTTQIKFSVLCLNTAINEIIEQSSFVVFPNPSTGKFSIQTSISWQNTEICIFNLSGRCVYHQGVTKPEDFQIDMSKHSKGVYVIEVANAEKRVSQKIVIQ